MPTSFLGLRDLPERESEGGRQRLRRRRVRELKGLRGATAPAGPAPRLRDRLREPELPRGPLITGPRCSVSSLPPSHAPPAFLPTFCCPPTPESAPAASPPVEVVVGERLNAEKPSRPAPERRDLR